MSDFVHHSWGERRVDAARSIDHLQAEGIGVGAGVFMVQGVEEGDSRAFCDARRCDVAKSLRRAAGAINAVGEGAKRFVLHVGGACHPVFLFLGRVRSTAMDAGPGASIVVLVGT